VEDPDLGSMVRSWRERAGLTVDEAAALLDIEPDLLAAAEEQKVPLGAADEARVARALEAEFGASKEADGETVLVEILAATEDRVGEPQTPLRSGAGAGWSRFLQPLAIAALLVIAALALISAWRATNRAAGLERNLELATAGLATLSGERDDLQGEVDRLIGVVAEAEQRVAEAAEAARVEWEPLIAVNEDLVIENQFLRKAVVVSSASGDVATVGLTFGGDPTPDALGIVLDALAAENVIATFFPSGVALEANPGGWQRAVEEGHELGNATYLLTPIDPDDPEAFLEGLKAWDRAAGSVIGDGHQTTWFRPPLMSGFEDGVGTSEVRSVIAGHGLITALWRVETFYALYAVDGPQELGPDPAAAAVAAYVVGETGNGDIVLLQFGSLDIEAVPAILQGIREKGLQPGTLTQLIDSQRSALEGDLSGDGT